MMPKSRRALLDEDRTAWRRRLRGHLWLLWWVFVFAVPIVTVARLTQGPLSPVGAAILWALWLAAVAGAVWYVRLPVRDKRGR